MKQIEHAFLSSILESPDDDAPRLIYADWMEENGQTERAEFIRVQCKLWPLRETGRLHAVICCCDLCMLRRRERELLPTNAWDWAGKAFRAACVAGTDYQDALVFRRGFIEEITLPLADWLQHGPALVKAAPLRAVRLSDWMPERMNHSRDGSLIWYYSWPHPEASACFNGVVNRYYATEADALATMSRCCLEYARGQNTKTVPASGVR